MLAIAKIKYLFLAIRPKTLPAGAAPVLLGLAYTYAKVGELKSGAAALATLLCALLLQVAANLSNDYFDGVDGVDSGERLGPTRMTASGLLSANFVKNSFYFCLGLAFLIGLYLSYFAGIEIFLTGMLSILFCYLYTGGPYPLSRLCLGELLAFIFFGLVAVSGTAFIQGLRLTPDLLILGSGVGFISAAILAINNIRDRKNDLQNRKYTLAVLLGEKVGRALPLLFIFLSLLAPLSFSIYLPLLIPFLFFKTWRHIWRHPLDASFNLSLSQTGLFLLLYTFSFILGMFL